MRKVYKMKRGRRMRKEIYNSVKERKMGVRWGTGKRIGG